MAIEGLQNATVRERSTLDATGSLVNEVVITIVTDMGNSGTLVIPALTYQRFASNPEALTELITSKVNELDAVNLL